MKMIFKIGLLLSLTACSSGNGGSSGNLGSTSNNTVRFPGIGSGGGSIMANQLNGTWLNGCAGGSAGQNFSYRDTMTIKGNQIAIISKQYINNQKCLGNPDVESETTFEFTTSSYDTMGVGNFSFLNGVNKIKPKTQAGLDKLNQNGSGSLCSSGSFTLNIQKTCVTGLQNNFMYLVADNFLTFSGEGMHSGQNGFSYFIGNWYKHNSDPAQYEGSWAVSTESGFYKLLISGDQFMYIESLPGTDGNGGSNWDGEAIRIRSGHISIGANAISGNVFPIDLKIQSSILQTRSDAATAEHNTSQYCGISSYQTGIPNNLLTAPSCNDSSFLGIIRKDGENLYFNFGSQRPSNFGPIILSSPWHI